MASGKYSSSEVNIWQWSEKNDNYKAEIPPDIKI
jgi:hypothetical protein